MAARVGADPAGEASTGPAEGAGEDNEIITGREARYDGLAEWYDGHIGPFAEAAGREVLELLGAARGAASISPAAPAPTFRVWPVPGRHMSSASVESEGPVSPPGLRPLLAGPAAAAVMLAAAVLAALRAHSCSSFPVPIASRGRLEQVEDDHRLGR